MRILITGANRGLGYELAEEACARGHDVAAGVRSPEASGCDRLRELAGRYPGKLDIIPLDVTSESSVSAAVKMLAGEGTADGRVQPIDAVINSAAILLGREQRLEELDFEAVEQTFRTNVFGPMLVMKYILPHLRDGEHSCVLNISSEAGSFQNGYGGDYSYALSKSALNMFSGQLRSLLKPRNITVYAIHPGWIRTDMGGSQAPGDASESAAGILDIAERKAIPESGALFIDHRGKRMPL